jgi:ubiquitin C-terminal hydrolase
VNGIYSVHEINHRVKFNFGEDKHQHWSYCLRKANNDAGEDRQQQQPDFLMLVNERTWWICLPFEKRPKNRADESACDFYMNDCKKDVHLAPKRGWITCTGGKTPPPEVVPHSYSFDNGNYEDTLKYKLLRWCSEQNLVDQLFGASIHRAIVSSSTPLLQFLIESRALTLLDVNVMWKSVLSCDADTADEITDILVEVSVEFDRELFGQFMDICQSSLANEQKDALQGLIYKVATFVEKYEADKVPNANILKLLDLFWAVFSHPNFPDYKNSLGYYETFSSFLNRNDGVDFVKGRIDDCVNALSALRHAQHTVDEKLASKTLSTLKFLLSLETFRKSVKTFDQFDLPNVVIHEVGRFVAANRETPVQQHGTASTLPPLLDFLGEVSLRLNQLRLYYGASPEVNISITQLDNLWHLFKDDYRCLGCFFDLLSAQPLKPSSGKDGVVSILEEGELEHVFERYVCSADLDWSKCCPKVFFCFAAFFDTLGIPHLVDANSSMCLRGMSTLWSIFTNVGDAYSKNGAVALILKACPRKDDLMNKVFEILGKHRGVMGGSNNHLSATGCDVIVRCVELLSSAIFQGKSPSSPSSCSHAARGLFGRVQLLIACKKIGGVIRVKAQPQDETVKISIHPTSTILHLKKAIAQEINVDPSNISFPSWDKTWTDATSLTWVPSVVDDASISCSVLNKVNYPNTAQVSRDASPHEETNSLTIGEELANNSEYFTTLLAFCDDISDPVLAKKVWDLVMLIPTNLQFEEQVRQASHWAELLENNTSSASVAYSLQIIDHILQPSQDYKIEHSLHTSSEFQKTFVSAGGGLHILRILTTFSPSHGLTRKVALSVALRILRFFLSSSSSAAEADMEVVDQDVATPVFAELQKNAVLLVEKLLLMASAAASEHETEIVKDALTTISELIRDPAAASKLVEMPESRNLLISLLRSRVIKVRKEASTFAAHLGKIEPIVFAWLLDELQPEKPSVFVEIFDALDDLLCEFCTRGGNLQIDLALLSNLISDKMVSIARLNDRSDMKSVELVGHLKLLLTLVTHKPLFIQDTPLGKDFVKTILNDFLYTLPGHEEIRDPACSVKSQRRLALKILGAYLAVSSESFEQMLASLHHLTDAAEKRALRVSPFSGSYGGSDDKKTNVRFTGLKNQGCTCYMNSTLQQLYMNKTFREALLAVPLKETQRSTILHRSDEELVGMELLICAVTSVTQYSWKYKEPKEEPWNRIHVLSYSNQTGRHMVQFIDENQTQEMILRSQSFKLRRAPVPGDEETSSAQEKAIQVFEQLQRTFYHMQFSKRKYFDPLPLVAACASLDLNYNVFQQNDAAEFFDKLIERVEMVTKVVRPGEEVAAWEKVFERHIFGGRTTYRKVPLSCEKYAEDKQSCGQTQAATTDPVFKFEVQVRSKDNMYDSLNEGFVAETLDGDNKIQCDVCNEKKGAIRQPIISVLPNMLVFHLKRFDMDYTTFETVKLNNLLEFPQRINMLKYTMAGVDAEDRRKAREAEKAAEGSTSPSRRRSLSVHTRDDADDSDPDPADYEYELQGVLIHAGVAGGGHYFSFARDPDNQDKWFRLDDDDVTSFTMTPEQLALNCFGGAWEKGNGRVETRTSNALMVFYSKVNPSTNDVKASVPPVESTATAVQVLATDAGDGMDICNGAPSIDVPYVTGYEAFRKEVFDSNNEHTLKKYVNEEILHEFILSAIERANVNSNPSGPTTAFPWAASSTQSDLLLRAIEFGLKFFLKIAIHSQWSLKSRWLECFRSAFETCPSAALTFLGEISRENNNGLDYYFSDKASFTARAALVSLVTSAAKVASPPPDCQMLQLESESEDGGVLDPAVATCLQLVRSVRKCIFSLWTQSRFTINDPIVLLTRLSAIPALRQAFLSLKTVSQLSVLLDEDTAQRANPATLNMYLADGERLTKRKNDESFSADVHNIYVQTLECIAALLGRPAQPRLPLLEDASDSAPKERPFTAAAAHAFQAIFKEYWSRGMNEQVFEEDVLKGAFPAFQNYVQIRALFQRNAGDRNLISAQGFVQACQELVNMYGEEKPWVWLQKHGVLSDLSLATSPRSAAARIDPPGATLVVPAECVASLLHAGYYSDAFEVEAWADVAKSILDKLFCILPQAPNVMTRDVRRPHSLSFLFSLPPSHHPLPSIRTTQPPSDWPYDRRAKS